MKKHYFMTFKKKLWGQIEICQNPLWSNLKNHWTNENIVYTCLNDFSMLNLSVARQLYHLHLWKKKLVWSKCIEWGNLFARHAYWHLCKDSTGLDHCCDCVWSCRELYVCRDRFCQEKLTENQYNTAIKNCKIHRDHLCWEKFWRKIVTP